MLQRWTVGRLRALGPRFRSCIDLGCGYGDWTEQFAALCDTFYACEVSPELAARTQLRLARHRAARVECADVRDATLPRGADLICIGTVVMYLPDADALDVLRRVRATASRDAVVLVHAEAEHAVYRRPRELRVMFESAGLTLHDARSSPLAWRRASHTFVLRA